MLSEDILIQRLGAIVGPQHVVAGPGASAYAVDGRIPRAVTFPGSVEELSAVIAFASAERLGVAPWGSGTKVALGGVPERLDIVVGLSRLNALVDYVPEDMTATFQVGMLLKDAQAILGQRGQWIALDPPYADRATVGGVLATNSSGPRRLRYGAARDFLIATRVVHADGKITKGGAKVVKNVTGYDIPKMHVGALGTLGILAEATFRLYPIAPAEKTYLVAFSAVESEQRVIAQLLDSSLVPNAVELLDREAARQIAGQVGLPWQAGHYGLAVAIGSVPEAVDAQIAALRTLCGNGGGLHGHVLDGDAHHGFWRAVRNFTFGDGQRAVLKASVLLAKVSETVNTLRAFTREAGGSLVVLEAPPEVKARVDVWGPAGSAFSLMQRLKEQFDPQRILNPGRFVGGL